MSTNNAVNTNLSGQTGTGTFVGATSPTLVTPVLGAATATSLAFSPTTGGIIGTTAADNATAGDVGEFISSTVLAGSAVSLSNATSANVTSISLTAGDWDVFGNVIIVLAAGTVCTNIIMASSTASASLPTAPNGGYVQLGAPFNTGANTLGLAIGTNRVNVSSTTTIFLVANASFSVSTATAYGFIGARRVR